MATGMFGANPEELDAVGNEFGVAGGVVTVAENVSGSAVQGVIWFGLDATMFKADYQATVCTQLSTLTGVLEEVDGRLQQQAQDQTDASQAGGGNGSGNGNGSGQYEKPWWRQGWQWYKNILNSFKGPRFLMELGHVLRNPGALSKFFTLGWEDLTGFKPGLLGKLHGIEHALDNAKNPLLRTLYSKAKGIGDLLQLKPLSQSLEKGLAKLGDFALGRTPETIFKAGSEGIEAVSKSQTMDDILKFAGKEGRLLGKGLGVVGVGMDGYDMVQYAQHGQTGKAVYSGVKAGLGAASLIPGPVGWACAGASLGLAAYDNIPVVHNTVNAIGSGIADVAKKVWPF